MTARTSRHAIRHLLDTCKSLGYVHGEDLAPTLLASGGKSLSLQDLRGDSVARFATVNGLTRKELLALLNSEIAESLATVAERGAGREGPTPVLIMTALPLEAAEVKKYLTGIREVVHPSGTVYYVGTFTKLGHQLEIAVTIASEGNVAASVETERALEFFNPTVALFVGVAGGIKDDVRIGDVVIGSHVYDYSAAKEGEGFNRARIKTYSSSHAAVQRAYAVEHSGTWIPLATTSSTASKRGTPLRAFVKPLAAGPKLIASMAAPSALWIRDHCGDALAVEMEGFGFLHAAHAHPTVDSLVVRGISDLVDGKSTADDILNQPMAASRAAAFALTVASELFASRATKSN